MALRSRKKPEEPANHERWLISYADFITLLFALFVVLYAASKADAEKMKKVAESLDKAFSKKSSTLDGNGTTGLPAPFPDAVPKPDLGLPPTSDATSQTQNKTPEDMRVMKEHFEEILTYELGVATDGEALNVSVDDRGVILKLSAKDFFEVGSAEVKHDSRVVLKKIAEILKTTKRRIRIEGHTDSSRLVSERYPSNWELSTARAATIVRFLIKDHAFDPKNLEAAGLAEHHPIADNTTVEGRAKNRRVEIIVQAGVEPSASEIPVLKRE